jgi:hypothetical protein
LGTFFGKNSATEYLQVYTSAGGKSKLIPFGQYSLHESSSPVPEQLYPPLKPIFLGEQLSVGY